jgi:CBS domain-containing protein
MEVKRKTAKDIAARSKTAPISVAPSDKVFNALSVMAERNIGAVLVMEGERLVGILSERDCVRKLDLKGRAARETSVKDIMTKDVISVPGERDVEECRKIMSERRIRHLPIVDDGKVVGILSIRDVLEEVIAEDERRIQNLETERLAMNTGTY